MSVRVGCFFGEMAAATLGFLRRMTDHGRRTAEGFAHALISSASADRDPGGLDLEELTLRLQADRAALGVETGAILVASCM